MTRQLVVRVAILFAAPWLGTPTAGAAPGDLLQGAETVIPAVMNDGHTRFPGGEPVGEIRTRVTGVQFFVGDTPSTAPGGLSDVPVPTLRMAGVLPYYEINGVLSGVGFGACNHNYVYGTVGADGVDTRKLGGYGGPRKGLAGVPFRILYPAFRAWNGRVVQNRHGGAWTPPYLLFLEMYDPLAFVAEGGAFVAISGGGFSADGDENFRSPTTNFFDMPLAPNIFGDIGPVAFGGPPVDVMRPTARFARIGPGVEEAACENCCFVVEDSPSFAPLSLNSDVSLARDGTRVMENILEAVLGRRPTSHVLTVHSFTGTVAKALNHGRYDVRFGSLAPTCDNPDPDVCGPAIGNTARLGNNKVTPYDPDSDDIFTVIIEQMTGTNEFLFQPDHEYPLSVRTILVTTGADGFGSAANNVVPLVLQRTLVGSAQAGLALDDVLRIYSIGAMTHETQQPVANRPFDQGTLSWDESAPIFEQINADGRGVPLNPLSDWFEQFNPGYYELAFSFGDSIEGYAAKPDATPFWMQLLDNAHRWPDQPPPMSYLDTRLVELALAGDLGDAGVLFPGFPVNPCGLPLTAPCTDADVDTINPIYGTFPEPLSTPIVEAIYALVDGTVEMTWDIGLELAETKVKTYFYQFDFFHQWRHALTREQLSDRGLNRLGDYVSALRRETNSLIRRGLYHPKYAARAMVNAVERAKPLFR